MTKTLNTSQLLKARYDSNDNYGYNGGSNNYNSGESTSTRRQDRTTSSYGSSNTNSYSEYQQPQQQQQQQQQQYGNYNTYAGQPTAHPSPSNEYRGGTEGRPSYISAAPSRLPSQYIHTEESGTNPIVFIMIGIIVALAIALAGAAFWLCRRRKERRKKETVASAYLEFSQSQASAVFPKNTLAKSNIEHY